MNLYQDYSNNVLGVIFDLALGGHMFTVCVYIENTGLFESDLALMFIGLPSIENVEYKNI